MEVVKVVCTGRGAHRRHIFNEFNVDGCEVTLRTFRRANRADHSGERDDDGVELLATALVPASNDPRLGRDAYRFDCPYCPVDERPRRAVFHALLIGVRDGGTRVCDLSTLTA